MYSVGSTLLPYVFIVPGFGRFVSQGFRPNVCHAHSYTERSRDLSRPSQQGTRQPGACGAMSRYIHGLTSFSVSGRHSLQLRRPAECNMACHSLGEDTGEPSVPVREFNLIACPLVPSH